MKPTPPHRHRARRLALAGLSAGVCAGLCLAPAAYGEIEGAGVLGWRWFNSRSELGRYLDDPLETRLVSSPQVGMRLGWLPWSHFGVEGELTVVPTKTADDRASVLVMATRVQAVVNVLTGRVRPFVALGGGFSFASTSNPVWVLTDSDGELHAGAGMRCDLGTGWGVRADVRMTASPGQDNKLVTGTEASLSLYGRFPWELSSEAAARADTHDRDGDGVSDDADKCPDEKGAITRNGCPGTEKTDAQVDAERAERAADQAAGKGVGLPSSATPTSKPAGGTP